MTRSDFSLTSTAFRDGEPIPSRYTCEGDNLSPPLRLSAPPEGTRSLVLIADDPDAPDPAAPKRRWVHWVLYNLPPETRELPEALEALPKGTRSGTHDGDGTGYDGPCPPIGRHRYFFALYALDSQLPELGAARRDEVLTAMKGHVLAKAELMGTYEKSA